MLSKNDELFLTVAKSESISKAAEQLYISQPSLTKRMQQLEAQLGVALFFPQEPSAEAQPRR